MWLVLLTLFGASAIFLVAEKLLMKFWPEQYTKAEAAAKSEEFKNGHILEEYEPVRMQSLYSTVAMLAIPFATWLFRAEITEQIGIWNKVGMFSVCVLLVMIAALSLYVIIKVVTEHFPSMSNNIVKIMLGIGIALVLYFG